MSIKRRRMPGSLLGLVVAVDGGATVAVLADDVPAGAVAGALRHLLATHGSPGLSACRQPFCDAAAEWRPQPMASTGALGG